jgi:hypothetical protein
VHELRSSTPTAATVSSGGAAAAASHSGDDAREEVIADHRNIAVDTSPDADDAVSDAVSNATDLDSRDSDNESAMSASDSDAGHELPPTFDYNAWRSVKPMGKGRLLPVDTETGEVLFGFCSSKCWEPDCFVYCESYDDLHKHCEDVHDYFPPTTRQFKTLDELDVYIRTVATEGDLVKVSGGMHGQQDWRCPLNGRHLVRMCCAQRFDFRRRLPAEGSLAGAPQAALQEERQLLPCQTCSSANHQEQICCWLHLHAFLWTCRTRGTATACTLATKPCGLHIACHVDWGVQRRNSALLERFYSRVS